MKPRPVKSNQRPDSPFFFKEGFLLAITSENLIGVVQAVGVIERQDGRMITVPVESIIMSDPLVKT